MTSEDTETKTTYANPDGTLTAKLFESPIRVPGADGSLVAVDTNLKAVGGRLEPVASSADVSFSGSGDGLLASLDTAGSSSVGLGFDGALGAPTVQGDSASYSIGANDSASVSVRSSTSGFSARVVLPSAPATAPTYVFPLTLHGLHASLEHNQLLLTNDAGDVEADSAPLSMWDSRVDAAGDPNHVVPVDAALITTSDGGQALQLRPSMDYLSDPDTQYPVTVDPDINSVDRRSDTYLAEDNPDTNFRNEYRIMVGSPDGSNTRRGVEQYYIDGLMGKVITKATLSMYEYWAPTCTAKQTNLYPMNASSSWPTYLNWDNAPSIMSDARWMSSKSFNNGASGCGAGAMQDMDVTPMISAYTAGLISSSRTESGENRHVAAIELRENSEYATSAEKRFCSFDQNANSGGNCADSSLMPSLSVTYAPDLGDQSSYSMSSHRLNDRSTLEVNNDNGNALVKAKDMHVTGVGQDLSLTRWYNSLASGTTTSLGTAGWSLSGGPDVYLEKIGTYAYDYHSPDGHVFGPYVRASSSSGELQFNEPNDQGADADLVDNNDGTFTLTYHSSQMKYQFKAIGSSGNLYLSKTIDRSGNTIIYNYGTGTKLSSITDSAGRSFSVSYNTAGYISQITDSNLTPSRTWTYGYDTSGNLTSYRDPTYTGGTPVVGETDYDYTTSGSLAYLTKVTDPAQLTGDHAGEHPTTVLHYTDGQLDTVQYQKGWSGTTPTYYTNTWAYHDGSSGTDCDSDTDRYTRVTDSNSHDTVYCFKDRHNDEDKTIDVIDALGHHRRSSFTGDNQASSVTSPEDDGVTDGSTTAAYGTGDGGVQDQLQSVTEPKDNATSSKGATLTVKYSASSSIPGHNYLPTSKVDANGRCTRYTYYTSGNGQGLVHDAYIGLDPRGAALDCSGDTGDNAWHNLYNSHGSVLASWDANGADVTGHNGADETVYTYDTIGQLTDIRKPGGNCATDSNRKLCTSYTYDGAGRMATETDGRGEKTTYSYDGDDRTTQLLLHGATTCVLTSGNCIQYTYDGEGNLDTRTDNNGTTTLSYDLLNQQHTQETPDMTTVTTDYDGEANLTSYEQSIQSGSSTTNDTVTYDYNAADQVTTVSDSTGDISINPTKDGKPDTIDFPTTSHALSVDYDYFNSGKTKSIHVTDPGNGNLPSYDYSYKDGTLETDELQTVDTSTSNGTIGLDGHIAYDYGDAERLTSVTDSSSAGKAYSYDYDNAGQLQHSTAASADTYFGYDEAGDLCWSGSTDGTHVGQACPTTPSGDTTVNHDAAGENTGTSSSTNTYDADQRATSLQGVAQNYFDHGNDLRASAGSGSSTVNFAQGPLGVTARTTSAGVTFYTRDPKGNLLDEHGAAGTNYYLTNYQGSVMALVGASGDYLNGYYLYGPYGETTVNAQSGGTTADNNPWRYAGGYQDALEGDNYYHFGARYYSPGNGRWTQPDPKTGSINNPATLLTYGYGGDDPVNQTDLSGNCFFYCPSADTMISSLALSVVGVASSVIGGAVAYGGAGELAGEGLAAFIGGTFGILTGAALIGLGVLAIGLAYEGLSKG